MHDALREARLLAAQVRVLLRQGLATRRARRGRVDLGCERLLLGEALLAPFGRLALLALDLGSLGAQLLPPPLFTYESLNHYV